MKKKTVVFSLGGSLVHPDQIDVSYLKKFKEAILEFVEKGNTAIIVVGGGKLVRRFNAAARKLNAKVTDRELDWMGIKATKVNAELIRIMFNAKAYYKVLDKPFDKIERGKKAPIYISGGWKPGASTDHVAVHLAKNFKADSIVNLTNTDYVYNKDPKKHNDAKKYTDIAWGELQKIVGTEWDPGANVPFDPIAAKVAKKEKMEVALLHGKKITNLKAYLAGRSFNGTRIHP